MDAWRRMRVRLEGRGCHHLSRKTVRLNISISWPTITGEDRESVWEAPLPTLKFSFVQLLCPMDVVSGVNMLPQLGDVALAAPGGAGMPAVSFTNTSVSSSPTPGTDNRGCENGALMDSFGIFLQGLLAMVAFSTLMCEYDPRSAVMCVTYLTPAANWTG